MIQVSKADYDKLKNSYAESTKEAQKLNWVDRVRTDQFEFIKLYEADPKMAQKVVEHTKIQQDARELYLQLREEKYGEEDPKLQKEEILQAIEEKETKKEFNRLMKSN